MYYTIIQFETTGYMNAKIRKLIQVMVKKERTIYLLILAIIKRSVNRKKKEAAKRYNIIVMLVLMDI